MIYSICTCTCMYIMINLYYVLHDIMTTRLITILYDIQTGPFMGI